MQSLKQARVDSLKTNISHHCTVLMVLLLLGMCKHGGTLPVALTGGGLELTADFKFRSTNQKLQDQLVGQDGY